MALDTIAGIRDYRQKVEELLGDNVPAIGMAPATMLLMLDTLLGVIEEQDRLLVGGTRNKLESATITPLHQRRKVPIAEAPDLE